MSRKIWEHIIKHPIRSMIYFLVFMLLLVLVISKLPEIVVITIAIFMLLAMIYVIIVFSYRERKELKALQNMGKEDYRKKWMQYVAVVDETIDETGYDRNKLSDNWIEVFNTCMYAVACDERLIRRKFNDFDVAACLIYSLTLNNTAEKNFLFAFECAKKLICEPKEYLRDLNYGYNLELKVVGTATKVDITLPDAIITPAALVSTIRTYCTQEVERAIVQLSDYLHMLYLECK